MAMKYHIDRGGTPASVCTSPRPGFARQRGLSVRGPESRFRRLRLESLESRRLLTATINWGTTQQTIAGFGASSAWITGSVTSAQAQLLWSPTNGAGLTLLRTRIAEDGNASDSLANIDSVTSSENSTAQTVFGLNDNNINYNKLYGVQVWSTPWSPPAAWKSNGNIADQVNGVDTGGYLLSADYQNYATWLADYVANMKALGVTIYGVSMQNEPDWSTSYDSCLWTASEFDTVLADYVEPDVQGRWPFDEHYPARGDPLGCDKLDQRRVGRLDGEHRQQHHLCRPRLRQRRRQ